MVYITESLIRKRAEHNEGELSTLEEVSLHQQDIEKIEYLDKWCRELRIIYLQSNLISKIENVSRLKKLEYINLALNNIEYIENLEGCESLNKLDLTLNFIGILSSVENLRDNIHLADLYLTGNPCGDHEGYRDYVIATLPQLQKLDGNEITKTERILALQKNQKNEFERTKSEREADENYWDRKSEYTPESRIETHESTKKKRERESKEGKSEPKPVRQYIGNDGHPLNCNEPKVDFKMLESDDDRHVILDVAVFHPSTTVDYTQIVSQNKKNSQMKSKPNSQKERANSADFIDDPDVPPLI
ncbi:unnamed protein product [Rotaria magnacalcarata]|uniref:U2A'/phosphoprotein 32 family A C-terminal domain-containing protein n=1 Tax=Rotaria magnacalcarata TaxID=392030 RepID=A0A820EJ28_9BILA|nr:unnamed protein product [Rotaria magnacalcarata]